MEDSLAQAVMAINLSRSFARPCNILCDLTVDDVAVDQGRVGVNPVEGTITLYFSSQQPSIKFNGEGYTCLALVVKGPSWHTIEDIRADAEVVAVCRNPKGQFVVMSMLVRTNTSASPSKAFLNAFIPYALKEREVDVKLGDAWSLTKMIPPDPAYYSYKGKLPWSSQECQWVVFRSMGNIDPNEFAFLTKQAGNIPPKMATRSQEVFFNDTQHIAGVPNGKAYMRCKRVKKSGETAPRITPVKELEAKALKKESDATKDPNYSGAGGTLNYVWWSITGYVGRVGAGSILETLIYVLSIGAGIYAAYKISQSDRGLTLARTAEKFAKTILRFWNAILDRIIAVIPFTGRLLGLFKHTGQV